MKERLLITTAIGLMLGTGAFAQSPSEQPRTNSPAAAQSQTNPNSSAPSPNSAPSASSSTSASPSSTPSAQNAQSTPSATSKSPTTTSQSAPNASGNNDPARSQAQSNQASPPSQAPSQAQSAQPSNSPNQAQTNTAPPTNNRSQASPTGTNTNAGAQPSANTAAQPSTNTNTAAQPSNNQTNTAQSRSSNVSVSANLNNSQRTRVGESIARLNVAPVNNVNFSLSVGSVVPRDVRFQPLPADVVEVMPQYRGYDFFVVREDIVIVEPSTYKIVDVLPRAGRSTAAAPASHGTTFSERDREVIRKHARSRTEQRTTGSVASTRVQIGDRLPDSVEIRSFPEEVYRESPTLREYRYIERDSRTYLIEPHERTIIEEIE
jgi:hypothetical protein